MNLHPFLRSPGRCKAELYFRTDLHESYSISTLSALWIAAFWTRSIELSAVCTLIVVLTIICVAVGAEYFIVIKVWFGAFIASIESLAAALAWFELVVVKLFVIFAWGAHISAHFRYIWPRWIELGPQCQRETFDITITDTLAVCAAREVVLAALALIV